ncbi:uncharacterized protein LOC100838385 isoform X2 [Brachypodium distachyon]|uniref:Uncharacterized protein n=1 Tax=Brachypodium distachyon TaxID=15368 RepID=A0A2K2D998_BRADI|nr:uncharacterized protein LOC100838385 isoform X2 [Brachypodium distachyon]PNT70837.1 hypothetical protein BRADI_2g18888v3 [Brachypodium distachyon]|eukprot:XP_024315306.1 uncharacterized protein LOC100838385 isoform X2 [Brachypodium distachyon]
MEMWAEAWFSRSGSWQDARGGEHEARRWTALQQLRIALIDELVSSALRCQTISTRGEQEIASFSCFLSDTNSSLKQWSSRLKEALEASPDKSEDVSKHTVGTCSVSAAKGNGKLFPRNSMLPYAVPAMTPSHNLVCSNSNLPEDDLIVSPSPLVSWRPGSCMVESGKQLFLLTPLPKTKACSSRCPSSSKTELKATAGMDELNLPNLPVWKLTISDDNRPDLEQSVQVKEARVGVATPHLTSAKKGSSEDRLFSPFSFSIQKSRRALPSPCLKTALPGKKHVFSPISEGSTKEDILSSGPTDSNKPSGGSDDMLSDEKDLATRYPDLYGFNQPTANTCRRREADVALDWFLSPLKTCVLMDPSPTDDKPIPTPARHDNKLEGRQELSDDSLVQTSAVHSKALIGTPWRGLENKSPKGGQGLPDDKPIQTPAVNSKALLGTPWKGLESTNLKGRHAGETTLKRELWTRFEAVSTNELHFDKSLFQKSNGRSFIDMLEEAS